MNQPYGMARAPEDGIILVTESGANQISVLNSITGAQEWSLPSSDPFDVTFVSSTLVAITERSTQLLDAFGGHFTSNDCVAICDWRTGEIHRRIPTIGKPQGLVVIAPDVIAVLEMNPNTVEFIQWCDGTVLRRVELDDAPQFGALVNETTLIITTNSEYESLHVQVLE
jgi:DNA-binding beta-propeller fold protein YncE